MPPMPEKFAAASFERFRGWLVWGLRAKWLASAIVRINANKPQRATRPPTCGTSSSGARGPQSLSSASPPPTTPPCSRGSSCGARLASSTKSVTNSSQLRQCRRRQRSPLEHNGLHNDLDSSRKMCRLLTSRISARVLRPGTSLAANQFSVGGRLGGTSLLRTGSQSGMASRGAEPSSPHSRHARWPERLQRSRGRGGTPPVVPLATLFVSVLSNRLPYRLGCGIPVTTLSLSSVRHASFACIPH